MLQSRLRCGAPVHGPCIQRHVGRSIHAAIRPRSLACRSASAKAEVGGPITDPVEVSEAPADVLGGSLVEVDEDELMDEMEDEDEEELEQVDQIEDEPFGQPDEQPFEDEDGLERVYLVGVDVWGGKGGRNNAVGKAMYTVQESLEELGRLADTAGLKVVGTTYQALENPNNATYIGSGKVAEVSRAVRALHAETVIFDTELSAGQLRNLEKALSGKEDNARSVRVGDRTALILDIFSSRAATREGKLQVELAQVEYQLPRLTRMWSHLDRVGGGGQVKGAGEKQIETDKRLLRDRANALRKELESVRIHRKAYRDRRAIAPIPVVALVGYTNAGKSTLLNRLTQANVLAEDKLFATLDPTTRKIRIKGSGEMLLSDTVGFIQKLPTQLIAAFRATLEEAQDASVLLHLVDISHANAAAQCEAVLQVLGDLGVGDIPIVTAWNKIDACPDQDEVRRVAAQRRDTVCVSGHTGEGVQELLELIATKIAKNMVEIDVLLPYDAGQLVDEIHSCGIVAGKPEYTDEGVHVVARVPPSLAGRLTGYSLKTQEPVLSLTSHETESNAPDDQTGGDGTGQQETFEEWAASTAVAASASASQTQGMSTVSATRH